MFAHILLSYCWDNTQYLQHERQKVYIGYNSGYSLYSFQSIVGWLQGRAAQQQAMAVDS